MYRGGIIIKTPEQIEQMAAAGADPGALPEDAALEGARRRHDRRARPGRRALHRLAGRDALVPRLPRLPRLDLRLAELDGRPRDPGRLRAPPRRHHLARRRRHQRRLGRRRRDHGRRSARSCPPRASCSRPPRRRCFAGGRAGAARQPPRRRLARGPAAGRGRGPLSIIRSLVGHGIGRDMHEDPQIPNYGEPGRGPELEPGMVLAIEPMVNAGGPRRPPRRRQLGRLLGRRLARRPLRVHGRGDRGRAPDPHPLARRSDGRSAVAIAVVSVGFRACCCCPPPDSLGLAGLLT